MYVAYQAFYYATDSMLNAKDIMDAFKYKLLALHLTKGTSAQVYWCYYLYTHQYMLIWNWFYRTTVQLHSTQFDMIVEYKYKVYVKYVQ